MNRVWVERATEEDLESIHQIDFQVIGSYDRLSLLTGAVGRREVLVAKQGAAVVVGFAYWHNHFFGQPFLDLLIVAPEFQRQGVASALVAYLARVLPGDKLFSSTNESNLPARTLFEKLDFIRAGQVDYLEPGDPEWIYVKLLERA